MDKEKKVVVLLPMTFYMNEKGDKHAARISELGLSVYGSNRNEAKKKVQQMFATYVDAHRKEMSLEKRLEKSGLEWYWAEDYEGEVERVFPDGRTEIIQCKPRIENSWRLVHESALCS